MINSRRPPAAASLDKRLLGMTANYSTLVVVASLIYAGLWKKTEVQPMNNVLGTRCLVCGDERRFGLASTICPECHGNLDLVYDYAAIGTQMSRERLEGRGPNNIWRYAGLLPLDPSLEPPSLQVGWTPMLPAWWLGRRLGGRPGGRPDV